MGEIVILAEHRRACAAREAARGQADLLLAPYRFAGAITLGLAVASWGALILPFALWWRR